MVLEDSHVQRAGSLETAVLGERDIVPEDRAVGRHLAADGPEVSGSGRNDRIRYWPLREETGDMARLRSALFPDRKAPAVSGSPLPDWTEVEEELEAEEKKRGDPEASVGRVPDGR
ncbi:MAG: hypothetical protein ACYC9S_12175 [Leptospirales bacterium]